MVCPSKLKGIRKVFFSPYSLPSSWVDLSLVPTPYLIHNLKAAPDVQFSAGGTYVDEFRSD